MCPPLHHRLLLRVVVLVVVLRQLDGQVFSLVALILPVEGERRILAVTGDEELASLPRHDDMHARLVRLGDDAQTRFPLDILAPHLRMPAVGHVELTVEPPENGKLRRQHLMLEHPEHLLVERVFRYVVEMIESGLCSPADITRGLHIVGSPVEHLRQLVPVFHLAVVHLLKRSAGDNQSVVLLVLHLAEVAVEHHHMLHRRVLRRVAPDFHELNLHL